MVFDLINVFSQPDKTNNSIHFKLHIELKDRKIIKLNCEQNKHSYHVRNIRFDSKNLQFTSRDTAKCEL
jgi:hypothetical protein